MERGFAYGVRKFALGAGLLICALAAAPASATVVWQLNPNNLNAPAGSTTLAYTSQGYTITATGYDNNGGIGTPTELYYKNVSTINGAFETGLGVVNTGDHELQSGSSVSNPFDFIQFNLTSVISAGATSGSVSVASIQAGESFTIFGSNAAGTLGTQLGGTYGSSVDNTFVNLPNFGQFNYYSIAAATGDVIPVALSAEIPAVPEMNALLPIVGLLGVIGAVEAKRRRRLARS
jgi:hypothetical protein